MKFSGWKKKITSIVTAVLVAGTFSFSSAPAVAEAKLSDALGTLIVGGIQASQLKKEVRQINDTEEGRAAFFEQMKKEYGVNDDYYLNQRVDTIMANMTAAVAAVDPSINDRPYNYFINNDESFNAFCTLGRNMSINTGLFKVLTNDDEIAVVLGHEMGHGQKNHPAKGYEKQVNTQILAQAVGQAVGSSLLGALAGNAISHQGITKPQEWEADNLAFDYITHSNYNPGACAAVWQRSIDKFGDNKGNSLATILSGGPDHPSDSARRDNYAKKLNEYSGGHVTVKDGLVQINGQDFTRPGAAGDMSAKERSYFVAGNLASAYHNGHNNGEVTIDNGTIKLGLQPVMTVGSEDESAAVLSERLRQIK